MAHYVCGWLHLKSVEARRGLDASDVHQSLRLRRAFALPGVPWLLGWGQWLIAWLDRDLAGIRYTPAARSTLDVLAGLRRRLPWFLEWGHGYHLLSVQVDFDIVVDLRARSVPKYKCAVNM